MKTSKYYADQLGQAMALGDIDCQVMALLKDCYELAEAIEMANKQTFEADAITIIREAVEEMRNGN